MMQTDAAPQVLVACPDARPPAYQAVIALAEAGRLDRFVTGFYHRGHGRAMEAARQLMPCQFPRVRRQLMRRHERRIPTDRVSSLWSYDAALQLEAKLAARRPGSQHAVARWRTRRFDRATSRAIRQRRPGAAFLFSDVGSDLALPTCRRSGIPTLLSMVHGDVREERLILDEEARHSPDFFPIYLGDGRLDLNELEWLHQRRLRDIALADRILVPSDHIAGELVRHGTPRDRIGVVPYAADTRRFRPDPGKVAAEGRCTFLFAGGITQRKGIKYLLEAWRRVRRPGWTLQLVGALPSDPGPLRPYLDEVDHLGRVGHAEMPAVMAAADVFVFPSLFEGSAVVTYEALAAGLPSIVTAAAGSVVRDGEEGLIVPSRAVDDLAAAMARLGESPDLRRRLAAAARARAEAFDWPRYHASIIAEVDRVAATPARPPGTTAR